MKETLPYVLAYKSRNFGPNLIMTFSIRLTCGSLKNPIYFRIVLDIKGEGGRVGESMYYPQFFKPKIIIKN
jgi:hypothetical protein